jgi:hypothetical protein
MAQSNEESPVAAPEARQVVIIDPIIVPNLSEEHEPVLPKSKSSEVLSALI